MSRGYNRPAGPAAMLSPTFRCSCSAAVGPGVRCLYRQRRELKSTNALGSPLGYKVPGVIQTSRTCSFELRQGVDRFPSAHCSVEVPAGRNRVGAESGAPARRSAHMATLEDEHSNPERDRDEVASALVAEARELLQRLPTNEAADLLAALRDGSTAISAEMAGGAAVHATSPRRNRFPLLPLPGQPAPLPGAPGSPESPAARGGALEPIEHMRIAVFDGGALRDEAAKPDAEVPERVPPSTKLSERERLEWEALRPTKRALYQVMNLTRHIRRRLAKLPWNPLRRPSNEEIAAFILKTGGGYGHVDPEALKFAVTSRPNMPNVGCWSGSFHWKKHEPGAETLEPAHYLIASSSAGTMDLNLIKHFCLRKWNLKRPNFIISVTGSAAAFDLNSEEKDKIFKGMMEGTRGLSPWFITGGTDRGVMKYVGEARALFNPDAPLIGVAVLGVLKGGSAFKARTQHSREEGDEEEDGTIGNYADMSKDCDHFNAGQEPPGLVIQHVLCCAAVLFRCCTAGLAMCFLYPGNAPGARQHN